MSSSFTLALSPSASAVALPPPRATMISQVHQRAPHMPEGGKFSFAYSIVPVEVPEHLRELMMLEQQLVARYHPITKVYPKNGGTYVCSGCGTNVAQETTSTSFCHVFCQRIQALKMSTIVVRPPGDGEWAGKGSSCLPHDCGVSSCKIPMRNLLRRGRVLR